MKLKEFKNSIKERWNILKYSIYYTFQNDLAHPVKLWDSIMGPVSYVVMTLLFITVIFSKVKTVAGYSKDEMYFFLLMVQTCYLIYAPFTLTQVDNLISDVRNGKLDLILIKPLPHMFYITVRSISVLGMIRNGIPNIICLSLVINWNHLNLSPISIFMGIIIALLGQFALNSIQYILSFSTFSGSRNSLHAIVESLYENLAFNVPLEGLNNTFRLIFITIVPVMLSANLAASVMLQKFDFILGLIISLAISIVFVIMKNIFWNKSLKLYSSASS